MSPLTAGLVAMLSVGLALRGAMLLRDRGPIDEQLALSDGSSATGRRPTTALVNAIARRVGPGLWRRLGTGPRGRIARSLDRAGRPGAISVEAYVGRSAAVAILGVLGACLLLLANATVAALLLLLLSLLGPWILLSRAARLRQERLRRDLPDFLDVLSVTVRAGLSYRIALRRVAEALGGPMGEEAITTLRQMDLGASRRAAFLALRDRNDCEALSSFVTAQLQAEELGVPLAQALNDIAIDVRRGAHQDARKRAQRAAPRVSLIVTTLVVPASIILILMALFLGSDVNLGSVL